MTISSTRQNTQLFIYLYYFLLSLSTFRLLFLPFGISNATILSSGSFVVLSFSSSCLLPFLTTSFYAAFFVTAFLLLSLPIANPIDLAISFLETLSPILLLSQLSSLRPFFNDSSRLSNLKNFSLLFFLILVSGQILQFIGFDLPAVSRTPLTNLDFGPLSDRITSFVGSPGPFSFSLAFSSIALFYLFPRYSPVIFFFSFLLQVFSFSRSGAAVLLVFSTTFLLLNTDKPALAADILRRPANFITVILASSLAAYFFSAYAENIIPLFSRLWGALSSTTDAGNADRLGRMADVFNDPDPLWIFFGNGTGSTSRFLGMAQYESQLLKFLYEWGAFSIPFIILFFSFLFQLHSRYLYLPVLRHLLPLLITIILSMSSLQIFTSSPIVSSLSLAFISSLATSPTRTAE